MNALGPTNSPAPVQSGSGAAATSSNAEAASPVLKLSPGTVINGSISGTDSQGRPILFTSNGNLALTTNLALPQGATVSLQVQASGAQLQMVVLSVNNQPPSQTGVQILGNPVTQQPSAGTAEATGAQGGNAAATGTPGAVRAPSVVTSGSIFTASVISTTPPNALGPLTGAISGTLPPSLAAALAAGTPTGASPPGGAQTPATQAATPGAAQGGTQTTAATTERGSQISLRLITVDAAPKTDPAVLLQNMAQSRPAGIPLVAGTVTGSNNAGQPYIQTPLGLLLLAEKAPLPRNSLVALEILGVGARPAAPGAATGAPLHSPLFSGLRDWPALRETVAALTQIDPVAAQQFVNTVLPRPGMELTTSILFLLAALRGGDIQKWMGLVTIHTLKSAGRRDLINRLGEDFSQLAKLAGEPASSEWRSYLIPIFDAKTLNMVRLFTKKHGKKDEENEDQESHTRFLLDIELSKLGQLQFDGLVKPKAFELIIRSHEALPQAMRGDINTIFTNSLEITGYTGLVNFQVTRDFVSIPVDKTPVTSAEGMMGVTV